MSEPEDDDALEKFFEETFSRETSGALPEDQENRVDRIEQRALFQSTLKQSTSFIFEGFRTVITNLVASLCGHVPPNDPNNNYKP
jgi:DNA repair protein RadC